MAEDIKNHRYLYIENCGAYGYVFRYITGPTPKDAWLTTQKGNLRYARKEEVHEIEIVDGELWGGVYYEQNIIIS